MHLKWLWDQTHDFITAVGQQYDGQNAYTAMLPSTKAMNLKQGKGEGAKPLHLFFCSLVLVHGRSLIFCAITHNPAFVGASKYPPSTTSCGKVHRNPWNQTTLPMKPCSLYPKQQWRRSGKMRELLAPMAMGKEESEKTQRCRSVSPKP